jgi:hypothetical protein
MGIAESFRHLAEKAKARMAGAEDSAIEGDVATTGDKYENAAGDRFGRHTDRAQEAINERSDDFTGGQRGSRNSRDNPAL